MAKMILNPETNSIEFDDGRVIPIPAKYKKELLPQTREEKMQAEEMGKIRSQIGVLGGLGEGAFQAGEGSSFAKGLKDVGNWTTGLVEALSNKEGQDNLSFWERQGENYAAKRKANETLSEQISESSPTSSMIGKGLGIGADILLTRGMSGAKALPAMSIAEKGTDIFRKPGETVKDAAISSALGYLGDKTVGGLIKMANRRGAMRSTQAAQQDVMKANILGEEAVNLSNKEGKIANFLETQEVRSQNSDKLKEFQSALDQRKQNIIDLRNQRQQLVAKRESDIANLKKEASSKSSERDVEIARIKQEIANIDKQEKAALSLKEHERKQKIVELKNERQRLISERNHQIAEGRREVALRNSEREQEIANVKDEIAFINQEEKAAQKAYEAEVSLLPELKKKAQMEHSKNVLENVNRLEKIMGKDDRIYVSQINPPEFFKNVVASSDKAATKEARDAEKFINSLFPKEGYLTRSELIQRYQSLEKRIMNSKPESIEVLNKFKAYLGDRLPAAVQDAAAYRKIIKPLSKDVEKTVSGIGKELGLGNVESGLLKTNIDNALKNIPRTAFGEGILNGSLKDRLRSQILTDEVFGITNIGLNPKKNFHQIDGSWYPTAEAERILGLVNKEQLALKDRATKIFDKKIDDILSNFTPDLEIINSEAKKRIGRTFSNTLGVPPEVPFPIAPTPRARPEIPPSLSQSYALPPPVGNIVEPPLPVISSPTARPEIPLPLSKNIVPPPAVPPIVEPPLPVRPGVIPEPAPFVPESFVPQAAPVLPPASGLAERTGEALENLKLGNLLKTKGVTDNPLAKLAFLKYTLGKAALPIEAATLGGVGLMKALTSPTTLGQTIRAGAKKGGLSAVYRGFDEYAKTKYPSYNNGIIDDPNDRFDAVAEVEKDPLLDVQEKAMLQMKINRGQSILRK